MSNRIGQGMLMPILLLGIFKNLIEIMELIITYFAHFWFFFTLKCNLFINTFYFSSKNFKYMRVPHMVISCAVSNNCIRLISNQFLIGTAGTLPYKTLAAGSYLSPAIQ